MTAAQKIAKEKFKKAIAYRQKTGVSLKEAFAHIYGKKVVKKKAAKKVVRKKAAKKVGKIDPNKAFKKQMQVNKIINTKYKDYEYPVPPVYTGNWSVITWSNWIKKNGRKIGAIKRKVARKKTAKRKKPSEQSILNKIHKVKDTVNKLDEAQHKHMMAKVGEVNKYALKQYEEILNKISNIEKHLRANVNMSKDKGYNLDNRKQFKLNASAYKRYLSELKTHAKELKKHL
jgi:hypothetical protein